MSAMVWRSPAMHGRIASSLSSEAGSLQRDCRRPIQVNDAATFWHVSAARRSDDRFNFRSIRFLWRFVTDGDCSPCFTPGIWR